MSKFNTLYKRIISEAYLIKENNESIIQKIRTYLSKDRKNCENALKSVKDDKLKLLLRNCSRLNCTGKRASML